MLSVQGILFGFFLLLRHFTRTGIYKNTPKKSGRNKISSCRIKQLIGKRNILICELLLELLVSVWRPGSIRAPENITVTLSHPV